MDRRLVALLLALALVVRIGYVAVTPGYRAIDDADNYDVHARSIAAGEGFARIGPGPTGETAFRPPGYPYLLAGVYALTGVERAEPAARFVAGRVAHPLVGTAIVHRRSEHRLRWALIAGMLAGLTILTRANAAILLVPLAVGVWDARPRWSWRALAPPPVLVAVALPPLP